MLTIVPSSGPSGLPAFARASAASAASARGIGIDGEAGALALAGWIGDAGQGLFETVADGCFAHGHLVTSKSV